MDLEPTDLSALTIIPNYINMYVWIINTDIIKYDFQQYISIL